MPTDDTPAVTAAEARLRFRSGLEADTSGWCDGATQVNLLAVPAEHAADLREFTARNPRACPVVDVTRPGVTTTALADGADLRTDLPGYRIYRDGEVVAEVADASAHWRDDLVAFLIGCSFTFEQGLRRAGVPLRHQESGRNVPMYRTDRPCVPAGPFAGPLVVSLRPIPAVLVDTAVQVTGRYERMHGAPIHVGDPADLGIADLDRPDYGDPPVFHGDDVPVFWACGVTPQAAVEAAALPFAIGHAPGRMLITDAADSDWIDR